LKLESEISKLKEAFESLKNEHVLLKEAFESPTIESPKAKSPNNMIIGWTLLVVRFSLVFMKR